MVTRKDAWTGLWNNPGWLWCLALLPHAFALTSSLKSIGEGHRPGNLVDFLGAARQMLASEDIYRGGTRGYVYPPLIAFLYQPLAMLREHTAAVVSLGINFIVSVFTLVLVSRVLVYRIVGRVDPALIARVAIFGAFCTADKIKGELCHIETNVFMLLAFTVAMCWVDEQPLLAGMALGFAFNIKYLPLVFVPFLILRRRWQAIGWFAVWAVVFALLPALSMGWNTNLRAWAEASGGLGRLVGLNIGAHNVANVREITDPVSISLTSGLARILALKSPYSLALAGGIAVLFCLYAAFLYVQNKVPLVRWPAVKSQEDAPFAGLMAIEWMAVLLLTLIFSPFTNSRHLYMLLGVNIAAGVLIFGTRGRVWRVPLVIAAIVMALGVTFPPGGIVLFNRADEFWRRVGGPAWCMLGMYLVLIWTNVRYQSSRSHEI